MSGRRYLRWATVGVGVLVALWVAGNLLVLGPLRDTPAARWALGDPSRESALEACEGIVTDRAVPAAVRADQAVFGDGLWEVTGDIAANPLLDGSDVTGGWTCVISSSDRGETVLLERLRLPDGAKKAG